MKPFYKYQFNEHFFEEESKEMWYFTGVSVSRYFYSNTDNRNSWRMNYDLMTKFVNALGIEKIVEEPENKRKVLFQVRSWHVKKSLEKIGLNVPRYERRFPENIETQYLNHFVRGFFDAQVSCCNTHFDSRNKKTDETQSHVRKIIAICFGEPFLKELYKILVKYAGVKTGKTIKKRQLVLISSDATAVRDFLYKDGEYIENKNLYLPSKRERFLVKEL